MLTIRNLCDFGTKIHPFSMIKYFNRFMALIGFLSIIYPLAGCADSESKYRDEYFIRVGDSVITVLDFNRAFEIVKTSYSHGAMQQPDAVKEARLRFVKQMTEEMILRERARDIGIKITDEEVKQAVEDIKQDYPENVFDQILLEYAVSYQLWEKGLETRLLMEKVIAKELGGQIVVTPDDVSKYYEAHHKNDELIPDKKEVPKDINETIIRNLRRKKIEQAYKPWIKELQKKYIIEINKVQWKKIIGS
ncbi:MAG: SurA N-terminal domain-containing protein [Deltaproteobacteria bacterium]|nr:SurA N-terminal domain-containing protein [Deltaproteobacteria bacterium]MBW2639313.1 SurA N-terminal domain-containing protein [Deltaproteobacteria bacterium]